MAYTKRTCHKCGLRDIQPNMVQKTIKVESGQSKASAGANTWAASFLGDKSATKAVNKSLWGTSNRKYTRNKQVWECGNGCGVTEKASGGWGSKAASFLIQSFLVIAILYVIVLISA